MSQTANTPLWAKVLVGVIAASFLAYAWAYLASKLFLLILFKGDPPFASSATTVVEYLFIHSGNRDVVGPALASIVGVGVGVVGFPAWLLWPQQRKLYGDARFATPAEIRKAGLIADDGVIIGKYKGKYLTSPGQHHVMLAAPTGSGKGVGNVIPNLLNWNHSAIVLDVKRENFGLTAGFRAKHGHKVFLFDPAASDRRTHRWNFLGYVRDDHAQRVDDLQKIGYILFPDISGVDPIWSGGCRSLFLGLALYLFETPGKPRTPGQVAREGFGLDVERFKSMIADRQKAGSPLSSTCELALLDYLNAPDKTRDSIRKTFTSRMELFLNPTIDAATSANDFDLEALRKERITIYLGVTPDNLGRLSSLLSLFFQQVVDLHTRELPERNPALKYQLLLLIDEFAALGKMQVIVDAIAFIRGYNIRLLPIFQSPSQVRAIYGAEHALAFFQNHTLRIVYEPADFASAKEISEELGTETVTKKNRSRPTLGGKGGSVSDSDHGRAVLLPQELTTIGSDTEIIFMRGQRPVKCDKITYYNDPVFIDRLKAVAPSLAKIGRRMPKRQELSHALFSGELAVDVPVLEPVEAARIELPDDKRAFKAVELQDLDRLDSIPLSDFSLDFSKIEIPDGEMDEDDADAFADAVYQRMINS